MAILNQFNFYQLKPKDCLDLSFEQSFVMLKKLLEPNVLDKAFDITKPYPSPIEDKKDTRWCKTAKIIGINPRLTKTFWGIVKYAMTFPETCIHIMPLWTTGDRGSLYVQTSWHLNNEFIDADLYNKGFELICGIDEAGRGPLAGPVVVAGVIMPKDSMIEGVNDSKKVSEKKREKLYDLILEEAISYSVAVRGQDVVDEINILNATKQGVTNVVEELDVKPDLILVDALTHINTKGIPYDSIIKGDAKCYNIAAASIIALACIS